MDTVFFDFIDKLAKKSGQVTLCEAVKKAYKICNEAQIYTVTEDDTDEAGNHNVKQFYYDGPNARQRFASNYRMYKRDAEDTSHLPKFNTKYPNGNRGTYTLSYTDDPDTLQPNAKRVPERLTDHPGKLKEVARLADVYGVVLSDWHDEQIINTQKKKWCTVKCCSIIEESSYDMTDLFYANIKKLGFDIAQDDKCNTLIYDPFSMKLED